MHGSQMEPLLAKTQNGYNNVSSFVAAETMARSTTARPKGDLS